MLYLIQMSVNILHFISTYTNAIFTSVNWICDAILHHRSIFEVPNKGCKELVECVVCLSTIKEDDEIRELRCKHLFHKDCLDRCVEHKHNTCPLCRDYLEGPRMIYEVDWEMLVFNFCSINGSCDDDFNRWWLR